MRHVTGRRTIYGQNDMRTGEYPKFAHIILIQSKSIKNVIKINVFNVFNKKCSGKCRAILVKHPHARINNESDSKMYDQ